MITLGILADTHISSCAIILTIDSHGLQVKIQTCPFAQ